MILCQKESVPGLMQLQVVQCLKKRATNIQVCRVCVSINIKGKGTTVGRDS